MFHVYRCRVYCSQIWITFNKFTYIKANVLNVIYNLDRQCNNKVKIEQRPDSTIDKYSVYT